MNPERTQLRQQERTEQSAAQKQHEHSENRGQVREFSSVDELLRYDSEHNPVPPEVANRLGHTLEGEPRAEPKSDRPWYRRIFG